MLFNLRFFPNWAGKLSIEILPTYRNLVIAPVVSCESFLQFKDEIEHDYDYDLGFRNIGETVYNNITATTTTSGNTPTTTYAPKSQQFIGVNQVTKM